MREGGGVGVGVRLGVRAGVGVGVAAGVDVEVGVGVAVEAGAGVGVANAVAAGECGRTLTIPRFGIGELAQPETATIARTAASRPGARRVLRLATIRDCLPRSMAGGMAWILRGQPQGDLVAG